MKRLISIGFGGLAATLALPDAALAQAPGAALADRICAAAPDMAADRVPSDAALLLAADTVERQLAQLRTQGDAAAADPSLLALPADSAAAPGAQALARYCAAAGELMRLSASGSQRQALNYLIAAYRYASEAGDSRAPQIAYRLALVGAREPGVEGARGASDARRAVAAEDMARMVEEARDQAAATCGELSSDALADLTTRQVSLTALTCAADQALANGDPALAALANLRLARLEGDAAELPDEDRETFRTFARERAQRALPLALSLPAGAERTELVGRLAEIAIRYGDRGGEALREALASLSAEPTDAQAMSLAASLEARLALARGDRPAAAARAQAAILAESRRPAPARLPLHYLLLAEADPDNRAAHVHAAYVALDNLRPLLPRLDPLTEESSFGLYMRDVFAAAAAAQLDGAAAGDETIRIGRAQQIVEAYRQAELQSAFGSECLQGRAAPSTQELREGETILYPLLLPDRVELLIVSRDGTRRLPPNRSVGRADMARLVETVALELAARDDASWRAASRRLYDILVAPVADRLAPGGILAIVPDGPLRALPFAALIGPDGRFLVQETRLSVIPALAFAQPGSGGDGRLNVLAASLQRAVDLPLGSFVALTGTEREARIAVQFAQGGRFVPDFTRAELQSALAQPIDVLHLATHAAFNGRSDRAFIVANGEVIRLSELRDMIAATQLRGRGIDLIVLSACETAVGDDEASMGLAGAAVQAGASSVIGSLWQVNDAGTAELMQNFYSRFAGGRSRSEALREAQLALIEGGGDNAHPNVWAAFALLGAWR
jgi:CHAT domain-containing protein